MKTEANDTAYPSAGIQNHEESLLVGGLTKREMFSAMAMQNMVHKVGSMTDADHLAHCAAPSIARAAVAMADALIEELNKPKGEL